MLDNDQRKSKVHFEIDGKGNLNMQVVRRNYLYNWAKKLSSLQNTTGIVCNLTSASIKQDFKLSKEDSFIDKKTLLTSFQSYSTTQSFPRFPVPPLDETFAKFIKTIEVHCNEEELKKTVCEIENFRNGIGEKLQKLLEKEAECNENWLAKRWLKTAYLTYRDPVVPFSSPGLAYPTQEFKSDEEFLKYTSKLIYGALKFKQKIDRNEIPPEKMGKYDLDMSQYEKVFGTCRIPGLKEDSLEYNPDSKHFVVVYDNQFYEVPICSESGELLRSTNIYQNLLSIFNQKHDSCSPIGILSSDHRDTWGKAYQELISEKKNKESIEKIQKSLFVVCIDKDNLLTPVKYGINDMKIASELLIHGHGSELNSANRWFDKTIQIIVCRNGINGLCYEHSPAEGQPIAIMTDIILESLKKEEDNCNEVIKSKAPLKLEINISPKCQEYIENAQKNINKIANDLDMEVLHFKNYGKEFIKTQKLSPDSYIQMAIQYAFYKLHRTPGAHYESAHLRMYKGGRTETIRSCSNESIAFAKSMLDENCSSNKRVEFLKKAVNGHRQYTQMALQGKGVDRHLLGLKLMAIENNIEIPELYKTPGIIKSSHFRLSTSQVASKFQAFMCYGPLTDDGYGCCYNPRGYDMIFAISSWKHNCETSSEKFRKSLQDSLTEMMEILCSSGEPIKSKL